MARSAMSSSWRRNSTRADLPARLTLLVAFRAHHRIHILPPSQDMQDDHVRSGHHVGNAGLAAVADHP